MNCMCVCVYQQSHLSDEMEEILKMFIYRYDTFSQLTIVITTTARINCNVSVLICQQQQQQQQKTNC